MNGVILGSGPEARPIFVELHIPKLLRWSNASENSESHTIWHVNPRTTEDEDDIIHNDNIFSNFEAFGESELNSPVAVDSEHPKRKGILLLGSGMVAGPAARYITEKIFEAGNNLRLIVASKEKAELDALEAELRSYWVRNSEHGSSSVLSMLRNLMPSKRVAFVKIDVGDAVMRMNETGTEDNEGGGLRKLVKSVDAVVRFVRYAALFDDSRS